jgi:hypothetical protein
VNLRPTLVVIITSLATIACGAATTSSAPPPPMPTRTAPTPSTVPNAAEFPSPILDLTNWKLQLPTNAAGEFTGRFAEIIQPTLARYALTPYFVVRGDAVQFRAPTNGLTTSGSMYPRSELREMTDGGKTQAAWSTTDGTHTMTIEQAITAAPTVKRHVVAGQIHDGTTDVITIRLEYPRLFVDHNGSHGNTLTGNYVLGTRFTVKIEVADGQIQVYYNGATTPADTFARAGSSMYFKAGAYTQSNCQREAACGPTNYGEVQISRLEVSHT